MVFWTSLIYLLFSLASLTYNRHLKRQGFKGISTLQCFNPLKWGSVLFGFIMKFAIPPHVFEQFVLRFYDKECRKNCMIPGKCYVCGCDAIAKGWSPTEECSNENWGAIIWSKRKYEELRSQYPVSIEIKYLKGDDKSI